MVSTRWASEASTRRLAVTTELAVLSASLASLVYLDFRSTWDMTAPLNPRDLAAERTDGPLAFHCRSRRNHQFARCAVLPDDKELAGKIVEAETQHVSRKIEMGAMGSLLGSAAREKPGNIAALAIVLACVMIVVIALLPNGTDFPRRELLKALLELKF
jgi:hypothetical protein